MGLQFGQVTGHADADAHTCIDYSHGFHDERISLVRRRTRECSPSVHKIDHVKAILDSGEEPRPLLCELLSLWLGKDIPSNTERSPATFALVEVSFEHRCRSFAR